MAHRIEVAVRENLIEPREQGVLAGIRDLGVAGIERVSVADLYWLDGSLSREQMATVGARLLSDPVAQVCGYDGEHVRGAAPYLCALEAAYNRGVSDPLEFTILKGVRDLGLESVTRARSGVRYVLYGACSAEEVELITHRLLLNPLVQHVVEDGEDMFPTEPTYDFALRHVPLRAPDESGSAPSAASFGFFPEELDAIVRHYSSIGRDPTDVELETLAQTWSEHCVHKTFKARIEADGEVIDNLLRSTIARATNKLNKPWCLSVFKDNAGVIDFDGENAICFKVETHNHPSAVEPYGGAATGLGGVVRDVLGTGLGARPVLNTDVFCFAPPDMSYESLPSGVLHPRRVFKGVRAGVADYGNRLGIPTLNGTLRFDERFVGNPLVFCGTAGIMPHWASQMGLQEPGDLVVLMGGRTGRDGIHGVTFASEKLDDTSVTSSRSAVQIGNAIVEKRMIDALMKARDRRLYRRVTDCGGGGLSSAVGEMGAETGVRVHLERVPLKYAGLSYDEIWISESQERMIVAVPPENIDALLEVCAGEGVEATVIGEFTDNQRLELGYNGSVVADLDMEFLHEGRPQLQLVARPPAGAWVGENPAPAASLHDALVAVLASLNVCSKEWVIRQYDHEVQGASVLKPLVGVTAEGPGDAAIIRPVLESNRGLAVSNGINTRYGDIDAYWMAASAIDEALRQLVAVGVGLDRVGLLDNFCWGRVSDPESLWALVQACRACHDLSMAYEAPFISGKDSLNNFIESEGRIISIPHTLLVSAIAVMDDVNRTVTMDLKSAGNALYVVGATYDELAGSEYCAYLGGTGRRVPEVRAASARAAMETLSGAIADGLVAACHDMSEGGLAVALAEMAFAGGLGASVELPAVPLGEEITRDDIILFSESNSRFVVEVPAAHVAEFERRLSDVACNRVGAVDSSSTVRISGLNGDTVLSADIDELKAAWKRPLDW
jgi:phosphoribosylformylglycinamidine synthase subunit PurSL